MSQVRSQGRGQPGGQGQRGRGGGGRGGWRGRGAGGRGWRGGRGWMNRGGGGGSGRNTPSNSQVTVVPTVVEHASPYKGWILYFPTEVYSDQSMLTRRIEVFQKYLLSWKAIFNLNDIEAKGFFSIDFKELLADQGIQDSLPELYKEVKEMPLTIVNALGLSMHQMIYSALQLEAEGEDGDRTGVPPFVHVRRIYCRLYNYEPVTQLKKLKANFYGKFVSVKGTVVRVSNIKPLCTQMAFECSGCGTVQAVQLPDGKYVMPNKCPGDGCRSRTFIPKRSHRLTETIDWQVIRIQEIINDDHRESGRIPRTVDCELTNDLVDSCVPGDVVSVAGDVKVMGAQEGRGRQKDKCMFLLYINANSVTNAKGNKSNSGGSEGGGPGSGVAIEFSLKELYAIQEIQSESHLFRLIVGSLCPTIYGHELVKAGLILGLLGGSQKYANDKNRIPVRGDPHILVVGDPGLGKSQMLQAVSNVAPRSVYVCGNTTTTSGLTVTMCKEGGGGGDYALEAGALVLADQGCCCIDEFDKMGNQHQALLEAMEQQSISIAKAGVVCSLPARTSIIAAANPVGGHYNKAKTVSENLRMGSALLSRFDLVFILLDKPDEEMDAMLSEHVMSLHAGRKRVLTGSAMTTPRSDVDDESRLQWEQDKPLSERLKLPRFEPFDPLPPQLLRKYVGYARKYVHPKIGPDAAQILQSFYLDLRKKHQTQDSTPITTRQLESLIRLTEARARLELREEATDQDARDVIEIMKYSMVDTYMDEFGLLDFQRSQHGSGMSCRSQAKKMIALLQCTYNQTFNSLFTVQEIRQLAKDGGINVPNFEDFISSLNNQGFLLKKGPRMYQLQTAGY